MRLRVETPEKALTDDKATSPHTESGKKVLRMRQESPQNEARKSSSEAKSTLSPDGSVREIFISVQTMHSLK